MRKETLGAALFFCGFGILLTFLCPLEGEFWKVLGGCLFIIAGLRMAGCLRR